jgi:hypothetical protein
MRRDSQSRARPREPTRGAGRHHGAQQIVVGCVGVVPPSAPPVTGHAPPLNVTVPLMRTESGVYPSRRHVSGRFVVSLGEPPHPDEFQSWSCPPLQLPPARAPHAPLQPRVSVKPPCARRRAGYPPGHGTSPLATTQSFGPNGAAALGAHT